MQSPLGAIYSTNITPDPETGIGNYTFEDFVRAMRQGRTPDGIHLYPAMPYPSYAKVSDEDLKALYAYFMQAVPAVQQENKPSDIPWPLNMRWPISLWNGLFLPEGMFDADPERSDAWNRGAYLVEGLGHCGTCHTPRGFAFQEKAFSHMEAEYLAGAHIDGWWATNLRNDGAPGIANLTRKTLVFLLKTGTGGGLAVTGSMERVISHSTRHLTDEDLMAIAVYLKSLGGPSGETRMVEVDVPVMNGAELYREYCSTCHAPSGAGYAGTAPALANNPTVLAKDTSTVIRVVLNGSETADAGPGVTRRSMPGYAWRMNDAQLASLITYLRGSWGNNAGTVTAADIAARRP